MKRALIEVHNRTRPGLGMPGLRVQLERVVEILGIEGGEWAILLVDDEEMVDLHERTLGLATTTDVLTFDLRMGKKVKGLGGGKTVELDTVICVDEAARQAAARGHAVKDEILLYAIHSLLHVCGYDDKTAAGARRMHRREDTLLIELGVGAVYGREAEAGKSLREKRGAKKLETGTRRRRRGVKPGERLGKGKRKNL